MKRGCQDLVVELQEVDPLEVVWKTRQKVELSARDVEQLLRNDSYRPADVTEREFEREKAAPNA